MKTSDAKTVSHIWQLAHLKHYFGHEVAIKRLGHDNDIQDAPKEDAPDCLPKRPSAADAHEEPLGRASS
ncbi:MAG TPA: hypothetical protein VGH51_16955 [Candidatus Angelobacter sp.]|jgi:hypothetical protein